MSDAREFDGMAYTKLGDTGLDVSRLCLGCMNFGSGEPWMMNDRDASVDLVHEALDLGINFLDTANVYSTGESENIVGDAVASANREELVLATKVYGDMFDGPNGSGLSRKHILDQVEASLDRLGTDYVDVLYTHRWDDTTPVSEFMSTLNDFVREGRVHYLATSTFHPNAWKIAKANEIAEREGYEPFSVTQPRYNAVNREIEGNYLEMARDYEMGVVPWSPLAGGFLTGKYERNRAPPADSRGATDQQFKDSYLTAENFDALEVVEAVAAEVGATPAQTALAWLLEHDQVTAPIVGASTPEQVRENVVAADIDLTRDQFERIADAK